VRGLVEQRDVLRVDVPDDAKRGEAPPAADVDDLEVAAVEVGGLERVVAHVLGPVARVDDVVVDDGEEAVEPEGLLLVLDEPWRGEGPRGGRGRRATEAGGGGRPALVGPRPRKPTPAGDRTLARPGAWVEAIAIAAAAAPRRERGIAASGWK
jgi:hypothetical protein